MQIIHEEPRIMSRNCESSCTRPHGTAAAMAGGIDPGFYEDNISAYEA